MIRCETEFAYAMYRMRLFGPDDLDHVKRVQSGYRVQPLSAFLGQPAPALATAVAWPTSERETMTRTLAIFRYLKVLLAFAPTHPSETELMARFAKIDVDAGQPFDEKTLARHLSGIGRRPRRRGARGRRVQERPD